MLEGWSPMYYYHVMVIKDGRTHKKQKLEEDDWGHNDICEKINDNLARTG